jgi:AP-4 complex subunit epsilon-1
MKILEILAYLGADDKAASEQMFDILSQVLKKADDSGINIGYALVYQCLKTVTYIYPS